VEREEVNHPDARGQGKREGFCQEFKKWTAYGRQRPEGTEGRIWDGGKQVFGRKAWRKDKGGNARETEASRRKAEGDGRS